MTHRLIQYTRRCFPEFRGVVIFAVLLSGVIVISAPIAADETAERMPQRGGYLFATFKGEQTAITEQVYFAVSRDGYHWEVLHDGDPALVSTVGQKGVRDPYLLRAPDRSKYYLIATDLSVHRLNHDWGQAVTRGSRALIVWESDDLVRWSRPRRVEVAPADAGCAWAPEAVWDEEAGNYLVFWASTTKRDDFAKHRIWAARTEDFKRFGEPFVYIESPTTIIDTTIVKEGDQYVRFSKDEHEKSIVMENGSAIDGPWRQVPDFSLAELTGYEGPQVYILKPAEGDQPATWCLILDHYAEGRGYQPYVTNNLLEGQFSPAGEAFHFPFHFRHGSVLPLTEEEFVRVSNARTERR